MMIQSKKMLLGVVCATLFACNGNRQTMQMGVPDYAVATMKPQSITLTTTRSGTFEGRQDIEIRPNVGGFITQVCVDEGASVKKGEVLFVIDPVQYEEAVNVARAAVEVAKATVATNELTVENNKELRDKNIISEYNYQMSVNTLAQAKAQLAQAEAQLVNAEKNLSYTRVTSPADGVIGKIPYRVGSLVSSAITTPLTTVSDISQMYVYFSMTEKELLDLVRQDSTPGKIIEKMPEVSLLTADGRSYEEKGKITTISEVIDQATGSVRARATFANPQRLLRSGGNGMVIIPTTLNDVIVIPQKATYELQNKRFVYVVNNESLAESREVQVYDLDDGKNFVITGGLQAGERVVMEGASTLRNGTKINPVSQQEAQAKMNAATGAAQQQQK